MTANLRRDLAVGFTAALVFLGIIVVPAHAAPPSTPTSCAGVWVAVQSDEANPSSVQLGCALSYATGLEALASAGFTSAGGTFVNQIDGLPTITDWNTNGHYYWSYWTAAVNADGSLGTWAYALAGADTSTPAKNVAEGWRLTNTGTAGPALASVPTSSPSGSPTPTASPSPTADPTPTAPVPTTSAPDPAPAAAPAPIAKAEALRAADFLSKNLPTEDDGTGAYISTALGLFASGSCDYAATNDQLISGIKAQAGDYVGTSPGRAANLAILVSAIGEDPTSFAGMNLLGIIATGTEASGQVGTSASSFVQSLAVLAYVRAGQTVPASVMANLLAGQDSSGAFGYTYGGAFTADFDTTGVVLTALSAAGGDSAAIPKAVSWATSQQNTSGYWPNPYSPVDSTGILGAGLVSAGASTGKALSWLASVQLSDGGFPASLDSTTSNTLATADAMWLLAGSNLATVTLPKCEASTVPATATATGQNAAASTAEATSSPAQSTATSSVPWAGSTLANTGASDEGAIGVLGVSMLVAGIGVLVLRRRVIRTR